MVGVVAKVDSPATTVEAKVVRPDLRAHQVGLMTFRGMIFHSSE